MEQTSRSEAPYSCPLLHHPRRRHHQHHHHPLCHRVHHQFVWRPNTCHHHHRHHHHHHHHCHNHQHPEFAPVLPQFRKSIGSYLPQKESKLDADANERTAECIKQVSIGPEAEQDGLEGGEENEEEDPIYVLTDEWKEFFAKSEAKRKLAKQQQAKR